jgi:hypothetical protein
MSVNEVSLHSGGFSLFYAKERIPGRHIIVLR